MNEQLVLIGDPEVAVVAVLDNDEPLVELDHALTLGGRGGVWVRLGIAIRLDNAAAALPDGVGLAVVDGHRPAAPLATAPHVAGAAVDLTLTVDGRPVWMGSELDATPEQSDGSCYTHVAGLDPEVANRRDVMALALGAAGLVNYPTEWWHWSHGDRYWAAVTGAPHAVYGPVTDVPAIAVPA